MLGRLARSISRGQQCHAGGEERDGRPGKARSRKDRRLEKRSFSRVSLSICRKMIIFHFPLLVVKGNQFHHGHNFRILLPFRSAAQPIRDPVHILLVFCWGGARSCCSLQPTTQQATSNNQEPTSQSPQIRTNRIAFFPLLSASWPNFVQVGRFPPPPPPRENRTTEQPKARWVELRAAKSVPRALCLEVSAGDGGGDGSGVARGGGL